MYHRYRVNNRPSYLRQLRHLFDCNFTLLIYGIYAPNASLTHTHSVLTVIFQVNLDYPVPECLHSGPHPDAHTCVRLEWESNTVKLESN